MLEQKINFLGDDLSENILKCQTNFITARHIQQDFAYEWRIRIHNFDKNIFDSIVEEFAKVSNRSVIELESNGEKLVPPTFSLQILQIPLDL